MAVQDQQAEVATVELTGSGVDILLPPPAAPVRQAGRGRLLVAALLAVGALVVAGTQLISFDGTSLLPTLAPATRILPAGAPRPQTLARQDQLVLLVPVQQTRITAILFHPVEGAYDAVTGLITDRSIPMQPFFHEGIPFDREPSNWLGDDHLYDIVRIKPKGMPPIDRS